MNLPSVKRTSTVAWLVGCCEGPGQVRAQAGSASCCRGRVCWNRRVWPVTCGGRYLSLQRRTGAQFLRAPSPQLITQLAPPPKATSFRSNPHTIPHRPALQPPFLQQPVAARPRRGLRRAKKGARARRPGSRPRPPGAQVSRTGELGGAPRVAGHSVTGRPKCPQTATARCRWRRPAPQCGPPKHGGVVGKGRGWGGALNGHETAANRQCRYCKADKRASHTCRRARQARFPRLQTASTPPGLRRHAPNPLPSQAKPPTLGPPSNGQTRPMQHHPPTWYVSAIRADALAARFGCTRLGARMYEIVLRAGGGRGRGGRQDQMRR
jgi:hypothetical protein